MSVTRLRMSRAPPMHWPMLTLSMTTLPNSLVSFVVRGRCASIFSRSFALRLLVAIQDSYRCEVGRRLLWLAWRDGESYPTHLKAQRRSSWVVTVGDDL